MISNERLAEIAAIPDEAIDTSDIPEAGEDFFKECRWSGWPGAWCLDCGRPDPREEALANCLGFDCFNKERCTCSVDRQFNCLYFGPVYEGEKPNFDLECAEPGSNRHNPYVQR